MMLNQLRKRTLNGRVSKQGFFKILIFFYLFIGVEYDVLSFRDCFCWTSCKMQSDEKFSVQYFLSRFIDMYNTDNNILSKFILVSELKTSTKIKQALLILVKIFLLIILLYLFFCSLSFLGNAFRLLGGLAAGEAFASNKLLTNPVAGLMIGILATVLVQSSSTTTCIIVTMVASQSKFN